MASIYRTWWQKFKKDYPDFENNRLLKGDFGKRIDKLEKDMDEVRSLLDRLGRKVQEAQQSLGDVQDTYASYARVVAQMNNKTMVLQFSSFEDRPADHKRTLEALSGALKNVRL